MRILVDLQGAQKAGRQRGIGRYSLALAKAMARHRGNHEIFILLNGLFPEPIDEIKKSLFGLLPDHHFLVFAVPGPVDELHPENSWRVRASELIREKFICDFSPDLVLVTSLFDGDCDNSVTSLGQLASQAPTAVILYDLIPYRDPEKYLAGEYKQKWYYRKIEHLKRADLLLAISDSVRCEAIEQLRLDQEQVLTISSAADKHAKIPAKKFSWENCAQIALEALEKLATQRPISPAARDLHDLTPLLEQMACIDSEVLPTEQDLIDSAVAIDKNEEAIKGLKLLVDPGDRIRWRIEGPFDTSYSLALLNRETARALEELGQFAILHCQPWSPDPKFLDSNPDLALLSAREPDYPHRAVDVVSRNNYPPKVDDMAGTFNLLHHYAWEESRFPQEFVDNFNAHLNGITCLSHHVEKILIDNGVCLPMITSGCGVDHWERIQPAPSYPIQARRFRFLHVSSCFPRKGIDSLLDAYGMAFSFYDDVSLIIKTFPNPHNEIHRWLAERRAKNSKFPHVLIIEDDISDAELKALYQQCQVLVAPSCAEGFGLPLAEAMLSGLPAITTAWSGQLDFCNEDNAWLVDYRFERAQTHFELFDSVWARIDVDGLADALRETYTSSPEELRAKALAGRRLLLENFKWVDVVGRVIDAVHTWRLPHPEPPKMRIGWITTWHSRCGIANYSEHLISHLPQAEVTVLAPHNETTVSRDDNNCIRCWNLGKEKNGFHNVAEMISRKSLNTIIIQFNYGFFNFAELSEFIEQSLANDCIVIVMMHATYNLVGGGTNWQLIELQSILSHCHRILVHSPEDLNRLKAIGLTENVAIFPHGILNYQSNGKVNPKRELPVVASYGFSMPHKGLVELVQAAGILKQEGRPVCLRMVNAEYPKPDSPQVIKEIKQLVTELKMEDLVEMHFKFLENEESLALLADADLIVFPYQESGESSSAAVRTGLATKRPVAVTPLPIFNDLGEAVFRFPGTTPPHIAQGIRECLQDLAVPSERARHIESQAERWRKAHDCAAVGNHLYNICLALRLNPLHQLQSRQVQGAVPITYRFHANSPLIKTEVGKVQGRNLITTNTAGFLMFGPYMALDAGDYQVEVHGALGGNGTHGAHVQVATGEKVLAESLVSRSIQDFLLASLPISLDAPCVDLEVRVHVNDQSEATISMLEIQRRQSSSAKEQD